MADTNNETTDIETDAAPSVGVVNLSSLDIGSECTVQTDLEPGSGISTHHEEEEGETFEETSISNGIPTVEEVVYGDQHVVDRDLEMTDHDQHVGDSDHEWIDRDQHVVDRNPEGIDRDQQLPDPDIAFSLGSLNLEETDRHEETLENDESIVNALLDQDSDADTLLHNAIVLDNIVLALNLIKLMVEVDLSLDVPNRLQQTALHLAVLTSRGDIVKDLLQAGASIFARDQHLRTPAFIACENNDMPMLIVIMQNVHWDMRDDETTPKLLNMKTHCLDVPNVDGERCLHLAVKLDNVEMARALIENGADPNLPDRRSGRTPLHVAADLGRVEITKLMISFENIDVNQKTYDDKRAIDLADMRGRPEVIALLQPLSFPMMKRKIKNK